MKAVVRPFMLASVLALVVAVPVLGAEKEHESSLTCNTDPAGMTSCFESETDVRVTESKHGSNVKLDGAAHSTTTDAAGNVIASYDLWLDQKAVVKETDAGAAYKNLTVRQVEQITENGATWCVVSTVVMRNGVERVNESVTTSGPC